MKVLLFCPTYRLEPETIDSIFRLDPAGHELHVHFTRWNPCDVGHYNILYHYRRARDLVLACGYDAMLIVESDMVIPADALRRLAAVQDADIVLGLYVHRHWETLEQCRPNVQLWPRNANPTISAWLSDHQEQWRQAWGTVQQAAGSGFGCVLIHRRVLEAVQFRIHDFGGKWIPADADTYFHDDAANAGFRIYCDLGVVCGHKTPEGAILWPGLDGNSSTHGQPSPYHLTEYQS